MARLLGTSAAAYMLGYATSTLSESRNTGFLGGREAPPHHQIESGAIRYLEQDLNDWIHLFINEGKKEEQKK